MHCTRLFLISVQIVAALTLKCLFSGPIAYRELKVYNMQLVTRIVRRKIANLSSSKYSSSSIRSALAHLSVVFIAKEVADSGGNYAILVKADDSKRELSAISSKRLS